jgi:hypothetical protein
VSVRSWPSATTNPARRRSQVGAVKLSGDTVPGEAPRRTQIDALLSFIVEGNCIIDF